MNNKNIRKCFYNVYLYINYTTVKRINMDDVYHTFLINEHLFVEQLSY